MAAALAPWHAAQEIEPTAHLAPRRGYEPVTSFLHLVDSPSPDARLLRVARARMGVRPRGAPRVCGRVEAARRHRLAPRLAGARRHPCGGLPSARRRWLPRMACHRTRARYGGGALRRPGTLALRSGPPARFTAHAIPGRALVLVVPLALAVHRSWRPRWRPGIPVVGKVIVGPPRSAPPRSLIGSSNSRCASIRKLIPPNGAVPRVARRGHGGGRGGTRFSSSSAAASTWRTSHRCARSPAASMDIADLPRERCVSLGYSTEVRSCTFGDAGSLTEVVLYGDSKALQWFDALERVARESRWRLVTVLKSGCAAIEVEAPIATRSALCRAWRARAQGVIIARHPALVIAASFTSRFGEAQEASPQARIRS